MRSRHALSIALAVVLGSPPARAIEPRPASTAADPWDVVKKIIGLRNAGELDEAIALARGAFDAAGSDTDLRRTLAREGKDVAVKLLERDRGNPERREAVISALCWATETMRTYQAELMTTERDRLTIPPEVARLESLAAGLATSCPAKQPESPPPTQAPSARSTAVAPSTLGSPPPPPPLTEGPSPTARRLTRTRGQLASGVSLFGAAAGFGAGLAACFAARGPEADRITALDRRATEAGRNLTDDELAQVHAADNRYARLSNGGKALGVFAGVSLIAAVVVLAMPQKNTAKIRARAVGGGVRLEF